VVLQYPREADAAVGVIKRAFEKKAGHASRKYAVLGPESGLPEKLRS
jgi:hypothetical protein